MFYYKKRNKTLTVYVTKETNYLALRRGQHVIDGGTCVCAVPRVYVNLNSSLLVSYYSKSLNCQPVTVYIAYFYQHTDAR